jgi:hypothetical protein
MTTTALLKQSTRMLFALAVVLVLGAAPAFADGPLNLVTTIPVGSVTHDVHQQGDFLYVATEAGFTVVDVSSPGTPVVRGSLTTATPNMGVKASGQYAYLAGVAGGLRVVDVSDPDAPVIVATKPVPWAFDVALKDDVVFIASFAGELFYFDVSNPLDPVQLGVLGFLAWKTPGPDAYGLSTLNGYVTQGNGKITAAVIKDNALVLTEWGYGRIYYYDVTNAASPVFRGTHYAPYIQDVAIDLEHDVIYMLSTYGTGSGIYTVPVSMLRPDISTAHASCAECGYLKSTFAMDQGGIALGAGGAYLLYGGGRNDGEFHVVDVRYPLAMAFAASVPIGPHNAGLSTMMGAHIDGDRAYFAAGSLGVQVYDFAGLSGAITTPPPDAPPTVVNFALNAGAASTTSRLVTLNTLVTGGAPVEYRAGQSSDLSGAAWLPYATAPSYSLTGPNGTKQVYFQVRNVVGIASAVASDTITLNEPVPLVTLFAINGGATSTATRTVTLNSTVSNNPTEYRASESSTFAGAVWLPYAAAPSFELTPGNGTRRIYFQARNSAGTSAVLSDTIVLSEPTPVISRFAINNGASSTTSRTVTLDNTASGSPTEYRASESSTFAGAVWRPYAPAPSFELSAGVATKRVYFQLRNAAGATSTVTSDTIILAQ